MCALVYVGGMESKNIAEVADRLADGLEAVASKVSAIAPGAWDQLVRHTLVENVVYLCSLVTGTVVSTGLLRCAMRRYRAVRAREEDYLPLFCIGGVIGALMLMWWVTVGPGLLSGILYPEVAAAEKLLSLLR